MILRCLFLLFITCLNAHAGQEVNVYAWGGEIPDGLIKSFEEKTNIKVNFSTYDSNETLYAKLKTQANYDVILPSSYYIDRMRKQGLLEKLDPKKLPNIININPFFLHKAYDPKAAYSVPHLWGLTGLFYNKEKIKPAPTAWQDLWNTRFSSQLLMLDDPREVFSIALLSLGYSPNEQDLKALKQAYHKLQKLLPNIKLFANNTIQSVMIDEDALLGMAWNGDLLKAKLENTKVDFILPKEGFVIWVDCFAILNNAANKDNAYKFINFMISADAARRSAEEEGFATANAKGFQRLPKKLRTNKIIYPPTSTLLKGHFQRALSKNAQKLMNHYWQQLKLEA